MHAHERTVRVVHWVKVRPICNELVSERGAEPKGLPRVQNFNPETQIPTENSRCARKW